MGGHEDEFVETAVFEVDFAEPREDFDVEKTGFFADFADGGLFGVFAWFDVTLGDSPTVFAILDKKDFDVLLVFRETKNNTTRSRLADNFLDCGLTIENLSDNGFFIFFRKRFRNFQIPLPIGWRFWLIHLYFPRTRQFQVGDRRYRGRR